MFCPLEPAWGTWADWVNAAAAAVIGIVLVRLNLQTNRIARNANETNGALAALQASLADDARQQRESERLILLAGLHAPLGLLKAGYTILESNVAHSEFVDRVCSDSGYRRILLQTVEACRIELPDELRARLHLLDKATAAAILRLHQWPRVMLRILELADDKPRLVTTAHQQLGSIMSSAKTAILYLERETRAALDECSIDEDSATNASVADENDLTGQ